jgi:hypothetical protein
MELHWISCAVTNDPGARYHSTKRFLFRIPCPLRARWNGHIHTLGHKIVLALVDRRYFETNHELPELIPSLFCAMVIVVTRELAVSRSQCSASGTTIVWLDEPASGCPKNYRVSNCRPRSR